MTFSNASSRVVQSLWYGRPMALVEQLSIQSFLDNGYAFHLYVYENLGGIPVGTTICDASTIMPKEKCDELCAYSKTLASNLFRYVLLYQKGGWWVDCDVICLRPLPEGSDYVFGVVAPASQKRRTLYNTAVIFAPPKAQIFASAIAAFEASLKIKPWDSYPVVKNKLMRLQAWLRGKRNFPPFFHAETGSKLLTDLINYYRLSDNGLSPQALYPVHWHDWRSIFNGDIGMSMLAQSYCIHLWNNMFHEEPRLVDKPAEESVFCALARQYLPKLDDTGE